jgi:CHASE2 domain-containing sensor protein/serine phosphatase RsbU (regulator of sigma subunit)
VFLAKRQGSWTATIVLAAILALSFIADPSPLNSARLALFDQYQKWSPRQRQSAPAVIVAIDEASLKARGQWPWPRSVLAQLIDKISATHPAAIGVDILFPEADRLSADAILRSIPNTDASLKRLSKMVSNDTLFAAALARSPTILGFAGMQDEETANGNAGASPVFLLHGGDPPDSLLAYPSALRSLAELQQATRGQGLISTDLSDNRVRRVPVVAKIANQFVPSLTVEMLRIASGTSVYELATRNHHLQTLRVADISIPLTAEGQAWIYFGAHEQDRFVSAEDLLAGRIDTSLLTDKLVLVGVTGLGLLDQQASSLGERLPGVEIHAQFLENVFDGSLLQRPSWSESVERMTLLALGALLILVVPRLRPSSAAALFLASSALLLVLGVALFRWHLLLFDAATTLIGSSLVFLILIAGKLVAVDRHSRLLERESARAAGEMEAARRIQIGLLPALSGELHQDSRFSISAVMEPARHVGGDFYDFFMPSQDHLIALVGDVSGKGLPASMFMAITKVLVQGAALRGITDLDLLMRVAQKEIARNNPESLFVTLLAVRLDLRGGELQLCSAGHDAPYSLLPGRAVPERIDAAGGPPLCVIDDFEFTCAQYQMTPGEVLCIVTDGVTEANNATAALYGSVRLTALLATTVPAEQMSQLVHFIRDDVRIFESGAERSDDLTILALRWNGTA